MDISESGLFVLGGPRDRPFNPFRALRSDSAKAIAAEVLNELQNYEVHFKLRQRARRATDQATLKQMVGAIVADLVHRVLTVPDGWVAVPLSKRVLGKRTRYGSPVLSKTLPHVLNCLSAPELNFAELRKGVINDFGPRNMQSTIRAGQRLLTRIETFGVELADLGVQKGEESIILKAAKRGHWDGGEWVDYQDNARTCRYRAELERINDSLAQADIYFDGVTKDGRLIDEGDRVLRRYFNNGSFQQGGRLFGGFWQSISKAERASGLTIDGEEVVTLDFEQMAARVLYGLAKVTPPEGDAYDIPGYENCREGVKQVFNSLRFFEKPLFRFPKGTRELFPKGASVREVVAVISQKHEAIAHLFCQGIGFQDMFIESEILVDVLLKLLDQRITALPVHDAVIVAKSKAPLVKEVMLSVFQAHTGVTGAVEEERMKG